MNKKNLIYENIKRYKFIYKIIKLIKIYLIDYFNHPMNWYSIISYIDFLKIISFKNNINTFISKKFIEEIRNSN